MLVTGPVRVVVATVVRLSRAGRLGCSVPGAWLSFGWLGIRISLLSVGSTTGVPGGRFWPVSICCCKTNLFQILLAVKARPGV